MTSKELVDWAVTEYGLLMNDKIVLVLFDKNNLLVDTIIPINDEAIPLKGHLYLHNPDSGASLTLVVNGEVIPITLFYTKLQFHVYNDKYVNPDSVIGWNSDILLDLVDKIGEKI
jgi:hypothetical protein